MIVSCVRLHDAMLLYSRYVSSDVWVGATTTLVDAILGGAISFLLSWQQAREARRQRQEDDTRERRRLSIDRRVYRVLRLPDPGPVIP